MEDLVAYFDGKYQKKSLIQMDIDNIAFTRGYGAYECFRSYNKRPFHLTEHIERLKRTCEKLLIPFPAEDFFAITSNLIENNPYKDLIFRVYVTDHTEREGDYHLVVLANTPDHFKKSHPAEPKIVKTVLDLRDNKSVKSISYGYAIVESKKASKEGFTDILYVDEDSVINELSKANFFAIKGDTLYTPKKNMLLGITRMAILELAKEHGYHVIAEDIPLSFLDGVDEVFCSATIRGITPIKQIDTKVFPSHAKTLQLKELLITHASSFDYNPHEENLSFSHS